MNAGCWVPELQVPPTQLCPQGHFSSKACDSLSWLGSRDPPGSLVQSTTVQASRLGTAAAGAGLPQGHSAVTMSGGCGRAWCLSVSTHKPIPK